MRADPPRVAFSRAVCVHVSHSRPSQDTVGTQQCRKRAKQWAEEPPSPVALTLSVRHSSVGRGRVASCTASCSRAARGARLPGLVPDPQSLTAACVRLWVVGCTQNLSRKYKENYIAEARGSEGVATSQRTLKTRVLAATGGEPNTWTLTSDLDLRTLVKVRLVRGFAHGGMHSARRRPRRGLWPGHSVSMFGNGASELTA